MTDDIYTIRPYVLRRDVGTDREEVAVAEVDGVQALIVPVSEEVAHDLIRATGVEGLEAYGATVEEIETLCAARGLGTVGLFGLDGSMDMDVLDVETLAMVLEET